MVVVVVVVVQEVLLESVPFTVIQYLRINRRSVWYSILNFTNRR